MNLVQNQKKGKEASRLLTLEAGAQDSPLSMTDTEHPGRREEYPSNKDKKHARSNIKRAG
jgi:hypothetical protein